MTLEDLQTSMVQGFKATCDSLQSKVSKNEIMQALQETRDEILQAFRSTSDDMKQDLKATRDEIMQALRDTRAEMKLVHEACTQIQSQGIMVSKWLVSWGEGRCNRCREHSLRYGVACSTLMNALEGGQSGPY